MTGINVSALVVLVGLFLLVTVLGFWASNWRRGAHLASLDEWGLGGRTFGTWITWFLLGGDLYTAYTFVAVPAAMFALGSVSGFFAVPYTIILYPIIFISMARLWSVSYRHGYVTAADFVRGRYGSKGLSLAVAITGSLRPCHISRCSSSVSRRVVVLRPITGRTPICSAPSALFLRKSVPLRREIGSRCLYSVISFKMTFN